MTGSNEDTEAGASNGAGTPSSGESSTRDGKATRREPGTERTGDDTRRRFLATLGTASAATIAGCQGVLDSIDERETDTPPPEGSADPVRLPEAALADLELAAVGVEEVTVPSDETEGKS